jgi:hypothetical protein
MWILILIAVHVNNPKDIPGKITMEFPDELSCQQSLSTIKWQLKFENFKVDGKCQKQ